MCARPPAIPAPAGIYVLLYRSAMERGPGGRGLAPPVHLLPPGLPLCTTRSWHCIHIRGEWWCPVLPTARDTADVSATSNSQHRTGRRNGVSAPYPFGDCCRLCRRAYLGTVAAPACPLAQYERRSLPTGRTTTGTPDLEHLLARSHRQRRPRRSSRSHPCGLVILLNLSRPPVLGNPALSPHAWRGPG